MLPLWMADFWRNDRRVSGIEIVKPASGTGVVETAKINMGSKRRENNIASVVGLQPDSEADEVACKNYAHLTREMPKAAGWYIPIISRTWCIVALPMIIREVSKLNIDDGARWRTNRFSTLILDR